MSELDVRIVTLAPMRIASFHAFGPSPEPEALKKLVDWAKPRGLLADRERHRVFGFNDPSPSPGSPNYGYQAWITVGSEIASDAEATVREFPGGLYAVASCRGVSRIHPTWHELGTWCEKSKYRGASHQWLEEHRSPLDPPTPQEEDDFDLYCPISG